MITAEEFTKLAVKNERNGGLLPEELKQCNEFIAVHLAGAHINERSARAGAVDTVEAVDRLSRAWGWAVQKAKEIWDHITRFFKTIGRCFVGAWKRLLSLQDKAPEGLSALGARDISVA